jgi:hypothetical protein
MVRGGARCQCVTLSDRVSATTVRARPDVDDEDEEVEEEKKRQSRVSPIMACWSLKTGPFLQPRVCHVSCVDQES